MSEKNLECEDHRSAEVVEPGIAADERRQDRLWSAEDVAKFLGVSLSWVRKATARCELPSIHLGRRVVYDPAEVRAFVDSRRVAKPKIVPSRGR